MIREGSFACYDEYGIVIYEGQYRCDNNNLKLTFTDEGGRKQTILAQVLQFSENTLKIKYEEEDSGITVTMVIRKTTLGTQGDRPPVQLNKSAQRNCTRGLSPCVLSPCVPCVIYFV